MYLDIRPRWSTLMCREPVLLCIYSNEKVFIAKIQSSPNIDTHWSMEIKLADIGNREIEDLNWIHSDKPQQSQPSRRRAANKVTLINVSRDQWNNWITWSPPPHYPCHIVSVHIRRSHTGHTLHYDPANRTVTEKINHHNCIFIIPNNGSGGWGSYRYCTLCNCTGGFKK